MKPIYRHRQHSRLHDYFMLDLYADREKYHFYWGHSHDHDISRLLPLPNKPLWLRFKSAPPIHNIAPHHAALSRRIMPIKSRERT